VRHVDDVHDAEHYACGEQDEFDGHTRQYTLSCMDVSCGSMSSNTVIEQNFPAPPPRADISTATTRCEPTPLWAVRALVQKVIGKDTIRDRSCLEPACGRGHMSLAHAEYFGAVASRYIFDYGFGAVAELKLSSLPPPA